MTTAYPGAIDSVINSENDAVNAIENTLGVNPQGIHANVVARLNAIDLRLSLSERIFKASEYGGIQAAIDAAFTAGGGIALIPWGVTVATLNAATGRFYTLKPNVSLMGYGPQSIIKVPDNAGNYKAVFGHDLADSIDDVMFSNFAIDGNAANNAVAYVDGPSWIASEQYRMAFWINKAQRTTITGVQVRGLDCINTISMNGVVSDCAITDCYFDNPLSPILHDHSTIYTNSAAHRIQNNHFVGNGHNNSRTAIEVHGAQQIVTGNIERGYFSHSVIVVSNDTIIKDNLLTKGVYVGWGSTLNGLHIAA